MPYIKLPSYMLEIVALCLDTCEFSDTDYGGNQAVIQAKRREAKEAFEFIMDAQVLADNEALLPLTNLPRLSPRVDISNMRDE